MKIKPFHLSSKKYNKLTNETFAQKQNQTSQIYPAKINLKIVVHVY